MHDSIIFDNVDVSEIGRMSVEIALGGFTFGIGTTFANFHTNGTLPSLIDALNIEQVQPGIQRSLSETSWLIRLVHLICAS